MTETRPLISTVTREGISKGLTNAQIIDLIHEKCADPKLTKTDAAGIKHYYDSEGKEIKSNVATVAWYRNDIKKKSKAPQAKVKAQFQEALKTLAPDIRASILIKLAADNIDMILDKGNFADTITAFPELFPAAEEAAKEESPVAPVEEAGACDTIEGEGQLLEATPAETEGTEPAEEGTTEESTPEQDEAAAKALNSVKNRAPRTNRK